MTTPNSSSGALPLAGVLLALGSYPVARSAAGNGFDAMAALIQPPVPGLTIALRVVLLAAMAVTGGIALARPALGTGPVSGGVLGSVRVAGLIGAAVCVAEALTGQAARPLAALLVAMLVSVVLLVPVRRSSAVGLGALLGLALAVLLGVELAVLRTGLPQVVDIGYAVLGSLLLGTSVFGTAVLPGRPRRLPGAVPDPSDAVIDEPVDGPERELVTSRLAGIALVTGVLTSLAGVVQLGLTGPRTGFDARHTGYGVASVAQAALPVLVTLIWLLARRPEGRASGAELSRLATGSLVLAFLAGACLAALPKPAAGPEPGRSLLRPVDLGLRHLAVLVLPMRPGPNLVHIGDAGGGQLVPAGHQHGAPAAVNPAAGVLTVAAGGTAVPLASRPGAPGQWAVVDIPAGANTLTVADDGITAGIPIDVGGAPADPAVQRTLAGPDGPECAAAALGALAAGRPADRSCPSQALSARDAAVLGQTVGWLAGRGITTLDLAVDGTPRSSAAQRLVRDEATRHGLTVAPTPAASHTMVVLSGWDAGSTTLSALSERAGDGSFGGVVLAPWLLSAPVLARTTSEVLPLTFDPKSSGPRKYALTLAAAFPGETPTTGGYLAWSGGRAAAGPVRFYGTAQVNVPMGGPMDDMDMSGPGDWYPSGTVVPISAEVAPQARP
jgi:hypothetical protein